MLGFVGEREKKGGMLQRGAYTTCVTHLASWAAWLVSAVFGLGGLGLPLWEGGSLCSPAEVIRQQTLLLQTAICFFDTFSWYDCATKSPT